MIDKQGFQHLKVEEGQAFGFEAGEYNHLFFLLGGKARISCHEFSGRELAGGEFVLIPVAADAVCTALSDSEAIVFSFGLPVIHDTACLHEPLPVHEPLERFLYTPQEVAELCIP